MEEEEGQGSCWPETAAASPEHLHVQFHNRIKAVVLERRDGSVGQVYTGAYTEGIEVYFLTPLGLTCRAVQMRLCKATPSGKMGGKVAPGGDVLAGEESSPRPAGGWDPAAPPPGKAALLRPCSKFALITASSSGKPHLEERLLWGGGGGASQLSQADSVV